jgi:hypothetical protein
VPFEKAPNRRILLAHLAGRQLSAAGREATAVFRSVASRRAAADDQA